MRALAIAVIIVGMAATADASSSCHEVSPIVGRRHCSRFGASWSSERSIAWELGLASMRFDLAPIDTHAMLSDGTQVHLVTHTTRAHALAMRWRSDYTLARRFYVGTEVTFGKLTSLPDLIVEPAARTGDPLAPQTRGWEVNGILDAGTFEWIGPIRIGAEIALGPHFEVLARSDLVTQCAQGGLAVEARATASTWLSPRWSVNAMVGSSLLARDTYSITLGLGLHLFPYDGGR